MVKKDGKNFTAKDLCLKFVHEIYANNTNPHPMDYADKIARYKLTHDDDKDELLKGSKNFEEKVIEETKIIYSSIRKALRDLSRENKIGKKGKSTVYIPIDDANKYAIDSYLKAHLKPIKNHVQKVNKGTYIISIEKETPDKITKPKFHRNYNGEVSLLEEDLINVINYVTETQKINEEKIKNDESLLYNLKMFIGSSYCYDILKQDERIIIILDTDAILSEEKTNNTEEEIINKLDKLINTIHTQIYNPTTKKVNLLNRKRIEEETYLKHEASILKYAKEWQVICREDVIKLLKITPFQASQVLNKLTKKDKLKLTGRGAGARYTLK